MVGQSCTKLGQILGEYWRFAQSAKSPTGVFLLNLGTPRQPTPGDVRAYLKEFLMDPYVIDIPGPLRWLLVHGIILPKRPASSARAYQKIWTERGSPLLFHLEDLVCGVQKVLGESFHVIGGMRYGNPSIRDGLEKFKKLKLDKVILFPLYPQYSLAATESSIREFKKVAADVGFEGQIKEVPAFFDDPGFIRSFAEVAKESLRDFPFDHLLMSFHGLPERQVKKTDPTGELCLATQDCCSRLNPKNPDCYRAQCFQTARKIAEKMGLEPSRYSVCFQSRLGRTPWIKPFTDELYLSLPSQGVKKLAVLCPSFVADCLETLEEVAIRGRADFLKAGGTDFKLISSLNSSPVWVETVANRLAEM
ncbi:MAG: ferrochelatase [Bdellovibrio sp.]|nr:ferrochelatase [Bdellovibrio sp.]